MKFLHLSDLHIGKRLNEVSLLEDQEWILKQILRIIDDTKPQAVLIAGDVYDKSVPSGEAVTLFDDFLCAVAARKVPVLIISGNHDSPERLAFGNRLMEPAGIYLSPVYSGTVTPVVLADEHGSVNFWMLPFVKPANVRRFYPDAEISGYTDAVRTVIERMQIDPEQRNVLIAHQFVTGASTCDSEEFSVGGSDNVDASVFEGFDYVALGHIHGPQNICANRIRYCGTLLKYSFSEVNHHKSVTMVRLEEKGQLQLETIPLTPRHDLRVLRGNFCELTEKKFYETTCTEDYLHIVLTDEEDIHEAMGRLRVIYPNLLQLSYDNTRTRLNQAAGNAENVNMKAPLQLFEELYEAMNNQPMTQEQREFSQELIEAIREEMP